VRFVRGCANLLTVSLAAVLVGVASAPASSESTLAGTGESSSARASVSALTPAVSEIPFSDFLQNVKEGKVVTVNLSGQTARGQLQGGTLFETVIPTQDHGFTVEALMQNKVRVNVSRSIDFTGIGGVLLSGAALVLSIGTIVYFRREQRKQNNAGETVKRGFCSSRGHQLAADEVRTTFGDVAGIEESKQEVAEIVDFLKDPGKFEKLGGKIPKGVLMVGSPGTGKTLLARAIAGEAKVPFFSISGSDFVEMYVGVGAARVRDLFERAKIHAPCIIFIDEIDAVGRHRTSAGGGGHEEREQTLNQLLVEMDGFDNNKGIIVIGATNRPDVLDSALLRPGRFDRQVVVPLPDVRGREQILRVHMSRLPLAEDVDLCLIARGTPGFSGADLANLVNEAALFAARADGSTVGMKEFERARDKIMMGSERHSMALSEKDRKVTAYHEAGHVLVGLHLPDHDPIHKVSILPRGQALGVTAYLPEADRYSQTKGALDSRICALLGGRVAESLIFGERGITTGAANDIQCATEIARRMVTQYGMSERLGPLSYLPGAGQPSDSGYIRALANDTALTIDQAVREIVDNNYELARHILETHLEGLHRLAGALLRCETLDREQIHQIVAVRESAQPVES
jgi:cell division protease FtsH